MLVNSVRVYSVLIWYAKLFRSSNVKIDVAIELNPESAPSADTVTIDDVTFVAI